MMSVWEYSEFNAYTTDACVRFLIITHSSDEIEGKPTSRNVSPAHQACKSLPRNYRLTKVNVDNNKK